MKSSKVLELLAKGYIEELKEKLKDEIYMESLKSNPSAKKRYSAMKKYFTYVAGVREALTKPAIVEFDGEEYTSFCNSYSLVLTKESCGEMKMFNEANGNYPDVGRLVNFYGTVGTIDFLDIIAKAKAQGYKLKKSEMMQNKYLMKYDGCYFRIALVDSTFSIIDDGKEATVYHEENMMKPLTIKNDLGIAVIMPIRLEEEPEEGTIVIKVP